MLWNKIHGAGGLVGGGFPDTFDISSPTLDSSNNLFKYSGGTLTRGIFIHPDGTYMYGTEQNDYLFSYSMSTPYDFSTATYDTAIGIQGTLNTSNDRPYGLHFKPNGAKVWIVNNDGPDYIYEYDLSTAWDISTMSYNSVSLALPSSTTEDIAFSSSGDKVFTCNRTNLLYHASLSTDWDITSAGSWGTVNFGGQITAGIRSFEFSNDGTQLFLLDDDSGSYTRRVFQYSGMTNFDIGSATYDSVYFDTSSDVTLVDIRAFCFAPNGAYIYMTENSFGTGAYIDQYAL